MLEREKCPLLKTEFGAVDTYSLAETGFECFSPIPWEDPTLRPTITVDDLPRFPAIGVVSRAYQLNFWQHAAFEKIARHVIYAYRSDIERESGSSFTRPPRADLLDQLVGDLGGEAGAGKSDGSVETLAFTGVAAINVHGRTIHSARNIFIGENDNTRPSTDMRAAFGRVVLTMIDEISMTDQSLLGRADAKTRETSTAQDRIWGGRHLLFGGDCV